ncbi:hypothetical protein ACFSUD_04030 [Sulfitobacter aestuarii]|uniref:SDR family NAD(P)-dependent oxidoreductase n=1 Tax=Sulfitobacter aestuarii TaxID=2161676 RepID=A0ABW5U1V3_9RHOB
MTAQGDFTDMPILLVAACQPPGPIFVQRLVAGGARLVVFDSASAGLRSLAAHDPERVEPLPVSDYDRTAFSGLQDDWGRAPIAAVINLLPLARPGDISGQIEMLKLLMQVFGRGLVAGRGTLLSLASRPRDPLALRGQGLCAALGEAGAALGREFARHSVRIHTIIAPPGEAEAAVAPGLFLCSEAGRKLASATLELA